MAFEYYQVEDEIVSRLQASSSLTGKAEIVPIPDSENDYKRGVTTPRITVFFSGATAIRGVSASDRSVLEELSVMCNIQSRTLRGDDNYLGVHRLAKIIKESLSGFQTTHCGRLQFKSYGGSDPVRDEQHQLWYWNLEFTCQKLFVEIREEIAPPLAQVTLIDQVQIQQ